MKLISEVVIKEDLAKQGKTGQLLERYSEL
jgi:hypothetical protein